jgi:hypothetical protein
MSLVSIVAATCVRSGHLRPEPPPEFRLDRRCRLSADPNAFDVFNAANLDALAGLAIPADATARITSDVGEGMLVVPDRIVTTGGNGTDAITLSGSADGLPRHDFDAPAASGPLTAAHAPAEQHAVRGFRRVCSSDATGSCRRRASVQATEEACRCVPGRLAVRSPSSLRGRTPRVRTANGLSVSLRLSLM